MLQHATQGIIKGGSMVSRAYELKSLTPSAHHSVYAVYRAIMVYDVVVCGGVLSTSYHCMSITYTPTNTITTHYTQCIMSSPHAVYMLWACGVSVWCGGVCPLSCYRVWAAAGVRRRTSIEALLPESWKLS